jgi:hypothetical protein
MSDDGTGSIIGNLRDIALSSAALLFFLGFSYERQLLNAMGVAEVPSAAATTYTVFSFDAVRLADRCATLGLCVGIVVAVAGVGYLRSLKRVAGVSGTLAAILAAGFMVIASFPILYAYAGTAASHAKALITSDGGIRVAVEPPEIVPESARADNAICIKGFSNAGMLSSCRLRLIYEDSDHLYIHDAVPHALGATWAIYKDAKPRVIRLTL